MVWAIIVAAGRGERMGLGGNKVFHEVDGKPILLRCLETFTACGLVDGIVVVINPSDRAAWQAMAETYQFTGTIAYGGATRQASVANGLAAVPDTAQIILTHDAARPLLTPALLARCIQSARECGSGVAALPLKDTIAACDENECLTAPLERATLRAMQTPQAFRADLLREAYTRATKEKWIATDDASLVHQCGHPVRLVQGEAENIKLTTPEDLALYAYFLANRKPAGIPAIPRVGHGYDVHRLVEGRPLILCGCIIPYEKGLLGHSDADVALHALIDALLGAAALGDIGCHFPDTDNAFKGVSSLKLLEETVRKLAAHGFKVAQADLTIVAQRPKLKDHIPSMCGVLAKTLSLPLTVVNVKAKTTEGLGFEGEGLGLSAYAVAMVVQG